MVFHLIVVFVEAVSISTSVNPKSCIDAFTRGIAKEVSTANYFLNNIKIPQKGTDKAHKALKTSLVKVFKAGNLG